MEWSEDFASDKSAVNPNKENGSLELNKDLV